MSRTDRGSWSRRMSSKSNFPSTGEPQFARFVTDSDEMITAGSELVRYRISDGKAMATQQLAASLSSFAISEDRSACAISYKGLLEIRDTRSLQLRVSTSLTGAPESIRFSHDGGFLAVRESARLCVFRTVDLQQISEMECADQFSDYDVLWLPDGRIAATCDGGLTFSTRQAGSASCQSRSRTPTHFPQLSS